MSQINDQNWEGYDEIDKNCFIKYKKGFWYVGFNPQVIVKVAESEEKTMLISRISDRNFKPFDDRLDIRFHVRINQDDYLRLKANELDLYSKHFNFYNKWLNCGTNLEYNVKNKQKVLFRFNPLKIEGKTSSGNTRVATNHNNVRLSYSDIIRHRFNVFIVEN